jgi:hypothetical protein
MEGLPKLRLMLHCDVSSRKIDGLRCFDGEKLLGEISLEEFERAYEEIKEAIRPAQPVSAACFGPPPVGGKDGKMDS